MIIINPGTESRPASLENAEAIAATICAEFKGAKVYRNPSCDRRGFFAFWLESGGHSVELEIPGDDPEEFFQSIPFVSRRMYVDGSSWLWKYAAGIIGDRISSQ